MPDAGDDITPELVAASHARYEGRHAPSTGLHTVRDLPYGPDPRQRVDVHVREGAPGIGRPVLVFVHGGGWVSGNKSEPGSPYYDNIGTWAAREGYVGVTVGYRLAPAHRFPAGAEDVGAAVAWCREHIVEHGGDPQRIVLMGHSAGASHVAGHVARVGGERAGARAVILASGVYDLVAFADERLLTPYYGAPGDWAAASPLAGLVASGLPVMVAIAEHDPRPAHRQAALAIEALHARDERLPHIAWLAGHNHLTGVFGVGTDEDDLGDHVRRFVATHAAPDARAAS